MRFPQPGEQFGRYRIERILGQGGMGVVYAATDQRLDRLVAVKVITGPYAQNEEFLRRFHDEAAVLAELDSPFVIAITDHDEIDGLPFIVTQYVDGTDLGSLLQHGPLPAKVALTICAQIARGLGDAHRRGVIHRDIKPANVLLRDAGTPDVHAYVCDFGIARSDTSEGHTATGLVAGTWAYLAPERTQGAEATPASDLYALGCVLWTCLVGREPYVGSEVEMAIAHTQAPIPQLSGSSRFVADLNAVIARLMAKKPEERPRDAAAARVDLERLAAAAPDETMEATPAPVAGLAAVTAARPGAAPPTVVPPGHPGHGGHPGGAGRVSRRSRWPLAVAAVAVLTVVGGGIAWAVASGDDDGSGRAPVGLGATGDIDGDGFGDLVVTQNRADTFEPQPTWILRSAGQAFGTPDEGEVKDGRLHLADLDGDGRPDQVWTRATDDGTTLTVEVLPAAGESWSEDLTLDPSLTGTIPTVNLTDLTQDGRADLVVHDESNTDGRIGIHVAAAANEGGFGALEQWYGADAPENGILALDPADVDGDGNTDLVATVTGDDGDGWRSSVLALTSDGGGLSAGEPVVISGQGLGYGVWLVADLDGDGDDEPILAGKKGLAVLDLTAGASAEPVKVLEAEGKAEDWLRSDSIGSHLWGVSDVDGNRHDDVVRLRPTENSSLIDVFDVEVYLADETGLSETPSVLGEVLCGSVCGDAFVVVPPAR